MRTENLAQQPSRPALLPCPFCGCECNQTGQPTPHAEGCWFKVDRAWRQAVADDLDFSLTQDVIDSWNRRATAVPGRVDPAHLYDLTFALAKLRKARGFVPTDANLYDDIGAATNGLEYVINRIKEARAAAVCDLVQVDKSGKSEQPLAIGVDLAKGPDVSVTAHILSSAAREKLIETLEAAKNGLNWYRDALPAADSGADDEMHAAIDEALVLLGASEGGAE